jgi:hypothetical protein
MHSLQGIVKKQAGGPCVDTALALFGACRVVDVFLHQYDKVSEKYEKRPKPFMPIEELQSHTEYEGTVKHLHLLLDDVIGKVWAEFVCGAQQAVQGVARSHETQHTGEMWEMAVHRGGGGQYTACCRE